MANNTTVQVKELKPLQKIVLSLGLLPTSYLESMTYAELLMWFCKFLQEEVIPVINNHSEAITELQNWLNNLDVQDEIDHKLDEMVEAGTLQEIIADYLNSKAIFGFDTVQDMKEATNLLDGSYAKTLGYHSKNDDGSSLYRIRKITNNDNVDEGLLIAMEDDELVAELIVKNNIINAEQFGAYGDNTHEDSEALQKCIDAGNTKSYNVEMNKEYLIDTTLELYSNLNIDINKLVYTGNNEAILLDSIDYVILNIKEIDSSRNGITLKADTGLNSNNIINIDRCDSDYNCIQLIANKGIAYNKITFNYLAPTNYGIYLYSDRNTYSSAFIGENTVYGGKISSGVWGVYADGIGSRLAIPTLKLYNVCLETPNNGIYFNNVEFGLIDNPRYQEMGPSRTILSVNGDCRNTVFNGIAPLYSNSVVSNITTPTHKRNGILLNCPIAESGGGVIGKSGTIYSSGLSITPIYHGSYKYINGTTYSISANDYQYQNFKVNGESVLNLNGSYGKHNIDELIITLYPNASLIIYDASNTKIFDNTSSTSGDYVKYRFTCVADDNNSGDKWLYVTYPYSSI